MLSRINFRYLLGAVLILGFSLRLIFICSTEMVPVMWDARIYSSAALGLIGYISDPGDRFGHPELDNPDDLVQAQVHFNKITKKYIKGEKIEWSYYKIPTLAKAQNYLFLSGPTLPLYLAAIFVFDVGHDFMMVRLMNVIIDTACILLLMLIAVRLFDKRVGLLAGLLYLFYPPFIEMTGIISPEPLTILLILSTFYFMLSWYDNKSSRFLYLCGLTLGLLVLTKPTGVLLFIPFGIGFLYDNREDIKTAFLQITKAAIPFTAIVLPWVIITSVYFGTPAIRDPNYSTSNFRSSSSIVYEGYDLDYIDVDFWIRPTMYSITNDPVGYGFLLIKKFVRLWASPHHDFERSFLIPFKQSPIYHFIIILSGLFGIFLFWIKKRRGLIFLMLIPIYYTLIHIIFHSLARYNLNPMPMIIIAASAVLIYLYDFIRHDMIAGRPGRYLPKVILFLSGILFVIYFPEQPMINLFGVTTGIDIIRLLKLLILLVMIFALIRILSFSLNKKSALKMTLGPSLLLVLILMTTGATSDKWAEWRIRLDRPDQKLGVRIFIPNDFRLHPDELVRVGIDMTASRDRRYPFELMVCDEKSIFYLDRKPISNFYYNKASYNVYERLLDIDRVQMRAWAFVPLKASFFNRALDKNGYIDIIIGNGENSDGHIIVYGNYPLLDNKHTQLPSLSHHSIERFVEKGDPRIWTDYKLSSDSAFSYYIDKTNEKEFRTDDLSTMPGRQFGRYRIFIEVKRFDKTFYYF